ncbi:Bromodomain and PHD finger-containing protein 3 [Morella rubra]|uniref:Bromodomain and PHD finger-containing protein 3 n=1 Tax=Morella rubra TaxID=262757 RepID=A0A6A1VRB4_9ROSI|nr:Bromodomain and PHD finger-containing protein 3 [Morella rubra]
MGQIVKRKKKGRPSKADLARRAVESASAAEPDERGRKVDLKGLDSAPGTPSDPSSGVPLPDKKTLELILDKLQKKDTYGVYAEPVDPEELPDYHDVIEHPMDFATVRKKLTNGSYSSLEQFESDVFLICSNAMQYNAPDTIYHKQARTIQDLARKKFEKLRIEIERSEKDLKSEQKTRSNSLVKKPVKKPFCRTSQEPVGSDFSTGATLAGIGDVQNGSNTNQGGGCERPTNTDGVVEGNTSLIDTNLEKAEELSSGKGLLSKLGRKQFVLDDNRRATYNLSNQPAVRSDSIFTTFEGEIKQLVAVGLHAEYSYARSLARFAATLGPVAWKVASQRIEQAVPAGCKFGRGWVGDYEPLLTPVLMLQNRCQKPPGLIPNLQSNAELRKDEKTKTPAPAKEHAVNGPTSEGKQSLFGAASAYASEGKLSVSGSAGTKPSTPDNAIYQKQNPQSRKFSKPENKVIKQFELNSLPSAHQSNAEPIAEKQFSRNSETAGSRSKEPVSRDKNLSQSIPFKHPDTDGVFTGGLPNGKVTSNGLNSQSSDAGPNHIARGTHFLHGQEQGLSDPVQLMRIMAERAQKQHKSLNQSPVEIPQVMPSLPSVRRDDSSNAAAAAARAWMSIGAGGFKQATENSSLPKTPTPADPSSHPAWDLRPQFSQMRGEFPLSRPMPSQSDRNSFPLQTFVPQPVRGGNEVQLPNRPIVFPQLAAADLSRFQMQYPWRGLTPHNQPRPKQDTLPPDLNIGFQSPGSPVRPSSGVLVDSQQPDLALQL